MAIIGKYVQQKSGYKAFIPETFPPADLSFNDPKIIKLLANANLQLGKLDGLTIIRGHIPFRLTLSGLSFF